MAGLEYGPKADSLRLLSEAGLPVPDAFFLSTVAYHAHAHAAGVHRLLAAASLPLDPSPVADALIAQPLSPDVVSQLRLWFADFGDVPLAVRSSANAEDLPGMSFAGQHGTYFVHTVDELLARVRDCWASLFSQRAVCYREHKGIPHDGVEMGVIVQRLVPAEAAGVAFTADPVGGGHDVCVEACLGIGEALVSGKVTPDRFTISRLGHTITQCEVGDKCVQIVPDGTGVVVEKSVPAAEALTFAMSDETAFQVANLALQVEELLGTPVDVEWAYDGEQVWLLQARPITTLRETPAAPPIIWSNVNTGEILPDVATPFTWSIIHGHADDIFGGMFGAFGLKLDAQKVIGLVGGRIYFNLSLMRDSFAHIPMLDLDRVLGGMHDYVDLPAEVRTAPKLQGGRRALARALLTMPGYVTRHSPRKVEPYAARLRAETDAAQRSLRDIDSVEQAYTLVVQLVAEFEQFNETLAFMAVAMFGFGILGLITGKWLGDESGAIANKLVAGRRNVASAATGVVLWELAAVARTDDAVRAALLTPGEWREVRMQLDSTTDGRFLGIWDAFMAEHGHHRRGELEFSNPTWAERPDYILGIVRSYLARGEEDDPMRLYELRTTEAEETAEKCRSELRNPLKRAFFERTLRWGRASASSRENLKSEAVRWLATIRYAMRALGEQLVESNVLGEQDDVFFLTYEEIGQVVSGEVAADWRALVARRRAEHAHLEMLSPPPVVIGDWDERSDTLELPDDIRVLKGISVSAGVVCGPARVFLSADTEEEVLPGEILVAPFTDPGWTPYFVPAAGIVMDMGGMLSHGSIIAREYGIPAVVNVGPATRIISTGQMIEVDGDKGEVRIFESE